jgi:hypothetical protein
MFAPDRVVAHDISGRCQGGTELCAYMAREWNSEPAYLGDRGDKGDGDKDEGKAPTGLLTRVFRSNRSRVKHPQL